MDAVPAEVLDARVEGSALNDEPQTLRGQLAEDRPTLLAFVRHFGCCFCRELVKDLRIASETADGPGGERRYPKVVVVHGGTPEQGGDFLGDYWPGISAISDRDRRLADAFGLKRATLAQSFGPSVAACGLRAFRKGHRIGRPVGDVWAMSGVFLLSHEGEVLWEHRARHAGDHPDLARLNENASAAA